ncbi:hypothetical protein B0H11DRAFT_1938917 [Mycena galericulata]|nr:hypothetical protein B0H11DRAFT_1938917 [Mycena galericulata]
MSWANFERERVKINRPVTVGPEIRQEDSESDSESSIGEVLRADLSLTAVLQRKRSWQPDALHAARTAVVTQSSPFPARPRVATSEFLPTLSAQDRQAIRAQDGSGSNRKNKHAQIVHMKEVVDKNLKRDDERKERADKTKEVLAKTIGIASVPELNTAFKIGRGSASCIPGSSARLAYRKFGQRVDQFQHLRIGNTEGEIGSQRAREPRYSCSSCRGSRDQMEVDDGGFDSEEEYYDRQNSFPVTTSKFGRSLSYVVQSALQSQNAPNIGMKWAYMDVFGLIEPQKYYPTH